MNDIATRGAQNDLWEELNVKHQWFHILRAAILDNKIAEMGTTAWSVYCVIKAYTHLDSGESFPSQARIAGHLGVSVDTVARATDKLTEMGLIQKEKQGRKSMYRLIETVPLELKRDSSRAGQASQPYVPLGFQSFINQLQNYARTGNLPEGATFNVTLNITNVSQGDNSTVNISQVTVQDPSGANLRMDAVDSADLLHAGRSSRLRALD